MESCPGTGTTGAGKLESCKGCPNAQICANSTIDEDIPYIKANLAHLKLIVSVMSGKGGVGKSTISKILADENFKKDTKSF